MLAPGDRSPAFPNKNRTGVSSGKLTILNFSAVLKFPIVALPALTLKLVAAFFSQNFHDAMRSQPLRIRSFSLKHRVTHRNSTLWLFGTACTIPSEYFQVEIISSLFVSATLLPVPAVPPNHPRIGGPFICITRACN
jgi:hypothetical protein